MSDWAYGWNARQLLRMGFQTIGDVERCIEGYDDDKITRIIWGGRQGQLQRFEDTMLASMGRNYLDRHGWSHDPSTPWWRINREEFLRRLKEGGVEPGHFVPEEHRPSSVG